MKGLDQSDIKINNKKRIIKLLSKERELTKLDISRKLDISVPTVTTIVGELKEEGIVLEAGMATSTGGRKPVIIKFLPDSRYSIGVDLGKDFVRVILTNLDSEIIEDRKKKLHIINDVEVLNTIKSLLEELLKDYISKQDKILGIGFSLPGTVNEKALKLEVATNFKLKNISFNNLSEALNLPIYLENEANAGALAESELGIAKELSNLIYISVTEGIGAGIIINRNMYKGRSRRAGEVGHMTINKNGRLCNCGKKGCWETYASVSAVINDYNKESEQKILCLEELIERYKSNEEKATSIVEQYIQDLAEGIQNLIFIFNPDYIIIGGYISKFSDVFQKKLTSRIFEKNEFYSEGDVNIVFSLLGKDSNILGASLIPILENFN